MLEMREQQLLNGDEAKGGVAPSFEKRIVNQKGR
jgi:hypothetical protein